MMNPNSHVANPLLDRMLDKFIVQENGCWLWTAGKDRGGYGRVLYYSRKERESGRQRSAHRVMYELLIGPIPEGLELDHLCRTPACINPAHLEPVTHRENVLRGTCFSALEAQRITCPQGHLYTGTNTRGERICQHCIREQQRTRYRVARGLAPDATIPRRTHCRHGHEFTPENTTYEQRGDKLVRRCRTCRKSQH